MNSLMLKTGSNQFISIILSACPIQVRVNEFLPADIPGLYEIHE